MFLALVVLLLVTFLIYRRSKRYRLLQLAAKLPGKFALPFLGNALVFFGIKDGADVLERLDKLAAIHDKRGLAKLWVGQTLVVLVWEPKYLEIISSSPNATYKGDYYLMACGHSFRGVFPSPGGQHWKELRKPLTLSMTAGKIENNYLNVFNRRGKELAAYIEKNRLGIVHDSIHDISAAFVDIFGETHLGVKLNEIWDRKWDISATCSRLTYASAFYLFMYGLHYWEYLIKLTSASKGFEADKKKLFQFLKWVMDERAKIVSEKNDDREYYTDFLRKRQIENNISDKQICAELADVLVAGSETVSIIIATAVMYLGMFPEIQEKAYEEQKNIFGDSDRDLTIDDIREMKYLDMVFKETYRHMGNPAVLKSCTGDFTIGEYTIPEGAMVFPFSYRTRKDPKHWERPDEFYPEHFLPEKEAARNRFVFAQYGFGLRMCAGKLYGQISVLAILSKLVRNFKITSPLKYKELSYMFNIFLVIKQGHIVQYEKRR